MSTDRLSNIVMDAVIGGTYIKQYPTAGAVLMELWQRPSRMTPFWCLAPSGWLGIF